MFGVKHEVQQLDSCLLEMEESNSMQADYEDMYRSEIVYLMKSNAIKKKQNNQQAMKIQEA